MLLLVTIGLVVVGAVSLVIGFVQNSLPPIYVSIVCSLLAAGVLVVFSRLSRRQAATAAFRGPAPLGGVTSTTSPTPGALARSPELAEEPTRVPSSPRGEPLFPIADYDELRIAEILPLLEELEDDELHQVLDRERSGRNRATIVRRIDDLLRPSVVLLGPTGADREAAGGGEEEVIFPIADYDELRIAEILPLLPELDDVELVMVREREVAGRNRASVLKGIADLLGEAAPAPVNTAASAGKRAPAKKAAPKKAAAAKAPAKATGTKATATKAGSTRKTASKAAPAKAAAKSTKSNPAKATRTTKRPRQNPAR